MKKERIDWKHMTRSEASRRIDESHGMSKAKFDRLWEKKWHGPR